MNWKKLLIGTVAGGITYFLLGWLIYGIALKDMLSQPEEISAVISKEMNMGLMFFSCLMLGALLSYIYVKWANISTFATGAMGGAVIGALCSLWFNASMMSMSTLITGEGLVIDLVASIVSVGLTGGVIGWVLSKVTD